MRRVPARRSAGSRARSRPRHARRPHPPARGQARASGPESNGAFKRASRNRVSVRGQHSCRSPGRAGPGVRHRSCWRRAGARWKARMGRGASARVDRRSTARGCICASRARIAAGVSAATLPAPWLATSTSSSAGGNCLDVDTEPQLVAASAVVVLCAEDTPATRDAQCPAALAHAIQRARQQRRDVRVGGKLEIPGQTGAQGVLFGAHGAREKTRRPGRRPLARAAPLAASKPGTRCSVPRRERDQAHGREQVGVGLGDSQAIPDPDPGRETCVVTGARPVECVLDGAARRAQERTVDAETRAERDVGLALPHDRGRAQGWSHVRRASNRGTPSSAPRRSSASSVPAAIRRMA